MIHRVFTNPPLFPAPSRCHHHQRSLQHPELRVYSNWRTRTVTRGRAAWPGSPEVSAARCVAVGTRAFLPRSSRWHRAGRQPPPQPGCSVPRRGKRSLCGRREQTSRGQDPSPVSRLREIPVWETRGRLASGREQRTLKMVKKAASGHFRMGLSHWWNFPLLVSQMHKSGSRLGHAKNGKFSLSTTPRTGWGSS